LRCTRVNFEKSDIFKICEHSTHDIFTYLQILSKLLKLLQFNFFPFWEIVNALLGPGLLPSFFSFIEGQLHLCITVCRFSCSFLLAFLLKEQCNWKIRLKGLSLLKDWGLQLKVCTFFFEWNILVFNKLIFMLVFFTHY